MNWWRRFLDRDDLDRQLNAELRDHVERMVADYVQSGLSEQQARRNARLEFGGILQLKDVCREVSRLALLEHAAQDARYAVRSFRKTPGFTVAAIVTLALGIGATTAIFSVVSATLLRPLPYKDADRLVRIVDHVPAEESPSGLPLRTSAMNQDAFLWWRDQTKTLAGIAASLTASMTVPIGTETMRLTGARVSPSLFAMLGTRPLAGRGLTADDERHANVAVLSAASWARYFSSDPHIVGRTISLDGVLHTVVGVVPADFDFPSPQTELWTPYLVEPNGPNRILTVDVLARLRDGVPIAAASSEANVIGNSFVGLPAPGAAGAPNPPRFEIVGLQDELVEPVRPALRVLMAAVGVVLLIVCANVANLLMARGSTRQRELGIRRALGAGRGRVIRQILTESLVLSTAGGLAGTGLAFGGLWLLKTLTAVNLPALYGGTSTLLPGIERVGIDTGVLAFSLLVCLGTGLVFGLMPALHLADVALPHTSRHAAASGLTRARTSVRRLLTVSQLALATMLLVGAGLLIHSFVNLSSVDLGYSPTSALTFELVDAGRVGPHTARHDAGTGAGASARARAAGEPGESGLPARDWRATGRGALARCARWSRPAARDPRQPRAGTPVLWRQEPAWAVGGRRRRSLASRRGSQ
jgi:predicted permease